VSRRNGPSKGFTLLELMIVMAIISIVLGYAAPRIITSLTNSDIDVAQRMLEGLYLNTKSFAVNQHKPCYIQYDIDNKTVGFYPVPESSGKEPELEKKIKLPGSIEIKGVKTMNQPKKEQGKADIKVNTDGIIEKSLIYLEGSGDKIYTLEVKPFSGKFKVHDSYIEMGYGKQ
jgi:prepilin-type N-terminal cleavage/methylation domain-containing protein